MVDFKPRASLSPGLLARKGGARPAMRPHVQPVVQDAHFPADDFAADEDLAAAQADLGWDDHGDDLKAVPEAPVAINGHHANDIDIANGNGQAVPEVLRLREELVGNFADAEDAMDDEDGHEPAQHGAQLHLTPMTSAADAKERKSVRSALKTGRRAAFTLRVDSERHLRLRLACTLQNRSAQQVVTEALDRLLETLPGLEELARRARRH